MITEVILPILVAVGGFLSVVVGAVVLDGRLGNKPDPEPVDPVEAEARRLAAEEVAELDWRLGTGEKPEHISRQERAEESRRKEAERKAMAEERRRLEHKWAVAQAEKASEVLAKRQAELDAEDRIEETDSRIVKAIYDEIMEAEDKIRRSYSVPNLIPTTDGKLLRPPVARWMNANETPSLPDYAVEGEDYVVTEHVAKNGLGQTVIAVRTIDPIGKYAGGKSFTYTLDNRSRWG